MVYVVTDACVDVQDKSCMEECPVDCIYQGGRMAYINPEMCIDCGACLPACPVEAIYYAPEVPDDKQPYIALNKQFFDEVEISKGGRKTPKIDHDVEAVRALPLGA